MDVAAEAVLLPDAVALVVIIVEPRFAYPDHARVCGALDQHGGVDVGMMIGVVRMNADAGPNVWIGFGGRQDIVPFAFARRNVEHRGDAARARAIEHLALLLGEPLVIEVAVRIDEHYASPSPSGRSRRGKRGVG